LSVVLATSAIAFILVKYLGAAYLVFLGIKTIMSQDSFISEEGTSVVGYQKAFFQGITVEILNPKTALFFLAFIPQFVNPAGIVFVQFILLGCISVLLNTLADLVVIMLAGPIGQKLRTSPKLRRRQRIATGVGLISLGGYVAFAGEGNS
ncbi:MAG: LysE family translocator, partial [Cyanobacteria bacterium J06576_12]